MTLIEKYKAWKKKRYWHKRHLEFLQNMLRTDARWLSIHPLAKEICDRHELAASENWYKTEFRDISEFREKLYLNEWKNNE